MNVSNLKEILFLHFEGKATAQQNKEIGVWLSDPSNREQYYAWLDEWEQSQIASGKENDFLEDYRRSSTILRVIRSKWVQVAAILILAAGLSAGYIFRNSDTDRTQALTGKTGLPAVGAADILPASSQAILTTANGSRIVLNELDSGTITTQAGVKVCKTKDGKVVYQFGTQVKNTQTDEAAPADKHRNETATNTITTPRGGQYQLILVDGTKVWLNAASSLVFPVNFQGSSRTVTLTGEAYFEVAKSKTRPFIVHTGDIDIQVLGTHFNVNAYQNNKGVVTTLLEGSVRLHKGNVRRVLKPGQKGTTLFGQSDISVQRADLNQVMGWKNGNFIFDESMSIADIMKEVSRWYDVDVEIKGDLTSKRFGGTVSRYKDIHELLNNMELTHAIHYKIQGKKVIIMK